MLPKDFDQTKLSQKLLDYIVKIINILLRKCLKYKTTNEGFYDEVNKKFKGGAALQN